MLHNGKIMIIVLCCQADPLRFGCLPLSVSGCNFTQRGFEYPPKWLQQCFVVTWLVPHETAAVSAHVLCSSYNHAPVHRQCHFIRSHIRRVHVSLAVTCHQHLWQNDWDLACAAIARRDKQHSPQVQMNSHLEMRQIVPACFELSPFPEAVDAVTWMIEYQPVRCVKGSGGGGGGGSP